MANGRKKALGHGPNRSSPMTEKDIDELLSDLEEAIQLKDFLEVSVPSHSMAELNSRREDLAAARAEVVQLKALVSTLRGDAHSSAQSVAAVAVTKAKPDGRARIQQEAYDLWIRLKASGANPSIHSICEPMARWCAANGITTRSGVTPMAGTIRNTILGGSSGWVPPHHSREQAKEHVAQLAQVAQVAQVAQPKDADLS